jgi:hypothetical protein
MHFTPRAFGCLIFRFTQRCAASITHPRALCDMKSSRPRHNCDRSAVSATQSVMFRLRYSSNGPDRSGAVKPHRESRSAAYRDTTYGVGGNCASRINDHQHLDSTPPCKCLPKEQKTCTLGISWEIFIEGPSDYQLFERPFRSTTIKLSRVATLLVMVKQKPCADGARKGETRCD